MRKALRRVLIALLVTVAVIAVGLAIAQDQETLRLRSALAATDEGSPDYLAALVGSPVTYGNTFDVLQNGDEIYPAMLDAIGKARERLAFETFMVEDGVVAQQFVDALTAAAQRGVQVNVIIDDFGSSSLPEVYLEKLRAAGCHVRSYNEPKWYQVEEVNYRTHRKIMVVDGEVAFTGGAGVADHWLGNAQDPDHWRDTQVRMHGPVARLMEAAFYENFIEASVPVTPVLASPRDVHHRTGREPAVTDSAPARDAATLVVRSSASGGTSDMKRLYLLLIASARTSVDITTPYFVTDESSRWALLDAVGRGVRVRILTEGDITDAPPVKYSSRRAYQNLVDTGIELHEFQPTMLHTKTMVVDGVWSMFGSANFDNRSLELNDELNVAVHDRGVATRIVSAFEADLKRSARIDPEGWRRRPLKEKAREVFWGYWGEIF